MPTDAPHKATLCGIKVVAIDHLGQLKVRGCEMRKDVVIKVSDADRVRLEAIAADRNSPQKHVWRAEIILLTAVGLGAGKMAAHFNERRHVATDCLFCRLYDR